jgi:hypothetical protein
MNIEMRQRIARRNDPGHAGQVGQQPHQGRLDLEDQFRPARQNRHVAAELQRIAQPLLGMQQQDPVAKGRSVPERLGKIATPDAKRLNTPIIKPPALFQPPGQQTEMR